MDDKDVRCAPDEKAHAAPSVGAKAEGKKYYITGVPCFHL